MGRICQVWKLIEPFFRENVNSDEIQLSTKYVIYSKIWILNCYFYYNAGVAVFCDTCMLNNWSLIIFSIQVSSSYNNNHNMAPGNVEGEQQFSAAGRLYTDRVSNLHGISDASILDFEYCMYVLIFLFQLTVSVSCTWFSLYLNKKFTYIIVLYIILLTLTWICVQSGAFWKLWWQLFILLS